MGRSKEISISLHFSVSGRVCSERLSNEIDNNSPYFNGSVKFITIARMKLNMLIFTCRNIVLSQNFLVYSNDHCVSSLKIKESSSVSV